jgi:hypothetical protein
LRYAAIAFAALVSPACSPDDITNEPCGRDRPAALIDQVKLTAERSGAVPEITLSAYEGTAADPARGGSAFALLPPFPISMRNTFAIANAASPKEWLGLSVQMASTHALNMRVPKVSSFWEAFS